MATYNGKVTLNTGKYSCYIVATESDVSIANNTSKVTVAFHIVRSSWGWQTNNSYSGSIVIDGTTFSFNYSPSWAYGSSGDVTIATASKIVTHNLNGTKSCGVSATWNTSGNNSCGTASASGTLTLTTIPRNASILTAPNFTDEDNPTITYSNPAGTAVTTLQACIAQATGNRDIIVPYRDISKTGTSYTFNLTDSERTALRNFTTNSDTATVAFFIKSIIGTSETRPQIDVTLTIINANPTFSNFAVQDNNDSTYALTGDRNKFIKLYSNAKVTISTANKMVAKKQAAAAKYLVASGSKSTTINYSDTEDVTGTINNVDTALLSVNAVDSRNSQTSASKVLDMIDYNEPNVTTFDIHRVDGSGTQALLNMKGTYTNVNFGAVQNTLTAMKIRYKKDIASSYSDWEDITVFLQYSDGEFSVENATLKDITFDLGSSYDVQIIIMDELSETVAQGTINDGTVLMAVSKGKGVAFGGVYDTDKDGAVQVYGDVLLNGNNIKSETLYSNSAGTNETFELLQSAANFQYLDIYYKNFEGDEAFTRIHSPNGKTVTLFGVDPQVSATATYFRACKLVINGTSVTVSNQMQSWIQNTSANTVALAAAIKITKVIGYHDLLAVTYVEKSIIQTDNDAITVGLQADAQITEQSYNTIPFTTIKAQKGTRLSHNSGIITIGTGIEYIKVSTSIRFSNPAAQTPIIQVCKNDTVVATGGISINATWQNANIDFTSILVPVSENDQITIKCHPNSTAGIYIRYTSYATIEMI